MESLQQALIIEDDEDLAIIFTEALRLAGFDTKTIRDGQVAMDELDVCQPIVIVLDLHLPHVSGLEILAKIRADDRLKNTKVIIATADPRMSDLAEDADFVLIKPISFAQLRDLSARLR
ncbi:response regulators consisting of a CheY-like receiver domain and a winged-helix DNA-binding domain [Longilinea arvoryzae]|uniref:Response regulators consisting of a CheY-like receiver domain and a winged-helix DNA-binding domain n=1 Tax=Longilinea arvoryzae TaxID=360412 RepID=A0A0S7BHJ3_9CHLR|nr:response regulator [Longilinea arvoryzae]GAP15065.1 response regulators consisting of a CheY-like receiver domain and a winged-helix DNA-binding domain [Longilinea arvoryzae]